MLSPGAYICARWAAQIVFDPIRHGFGPHYLYQCDPCVWSRRLTGCWLAAQIVFNPSATVGALSEPMWGVEARWDFRLVTTFLVDGLGAEGVQW